MDCDDVPDTTSVFLGDDDVRDEEDTESIVLQNTIPHNWREIRAVCLEHQKHAGNYTRAMSTTNLQQPIVAWHSGNRSWQHVTLLSETSDEGNCSIRFACDPTNPMKTNLRLIKNANFKDLGDVGESDSQMDSEMDSDNWDDEDEVVKRKSSKKANLDPAYYNELAMELVVKHGVRSVLPRPQVGRPVLGYASC
jgi:hypothetical protein